MTNKYLEKIAKQSQPLLGDQEKAVIGLTGVGAGAAVVHHEYARGHLTGRETLYHGSTKARIDNIKQQGLRPNQGGGISKIVSDHLEDTNKPFVFTAKNKLQAATYSAQQEAIDSGRLKTLEDRARITPELHSKAFHKQFADGGTIAKINLPTWKAEHKGVRNPELKSAFKNINNDFFNFNKKMSKKITYDLLQNQVHTHRGAIGPEYIKGSGKYQANSLKEIGSYIRANPKRFLKGAGKAAVGTGIIAGGAAMLSSISGKNK